MTAPHRHDLDDLARGWPCRGCGEVVDVLAASQCGCCHACTGDGGRGHTLRGACMGAPCEDCGQARYLHLPDECPSTKVPAPEHVIADAMSLHFHFCDEPRMTDCGECRRVIATATTVYKALHAAGLLRGSDV